MIKGEINNSHSLIIVIKKDFVALDNDFTPCFSFLTQLKEFLPNVTMRTSFIRTAP